VLCYAKKEELMGYMVEMQKAKDGTKENKRVRKELHPLPHHANRCYRWRCKGGLELFSEMEKLKSSLVSCMF
jgi:hypothetical protein